MHCGVATPTDPGVPPRTATTGAFEVAKVTAALAGRYKIERVLGEGGMATVYLATDLKHKRKVAVKVMRPELASTLGADRFLREVEIAGQLSHPHILPMHDSGEADGVLYYVMPYIDGETLRERLQRDGALSTDEAMRLAREVTEALAYAHRRNIIHRDIKPANILLSEGHALVADFGIARAVGEGGGEQLTRTGLSVGTPQYMAPEQATGEKEVDGRADVYATGAVLYEMLAGEPPFTGPNARMILTRSLTEAPRPLGKVREGISEAIDAVALKALAKNPGDRFATADAMVSAIDAARQTLSGSFPAATGAKSTELLPAAATTVTGSTLRKWPTGRTALIGGIAALAILAVGATVLTSRKPAAVTSSTGGSRIAVLPFENQGPTSDEYFADGIADEVRGKLARVRGLDIIASSSSAEYKGSTKRAQDIARELGADYLLVGKVRWAGAEGKRRVQVVPELIDAKTGSVRWQQSFDNDITDVFEVQSQIASRVAGALGVALAGGERQELTSRPTTNVQAYQLYLKARAIPGGDPMSLRTAISFLEQAVALDSGFVDAWTALSIASARLFANGEHDPEAAARAKGALDRAIALNPQGARTQLATARYYDLVAVDQAKASAAIDRALQDAPNDAEVLAVAALTDENRGDLQAALQKLERARELDPRSLFVLNRLAILYRTLHRFSDAEAVFGTALLLQPDDVTLIHGLAMDRVFDGRLADARSGVRAAIEAGVPAPSLAAQFSGRQETGWILDERERQVVFRLTRQAFDNDQAWWAQSLASLYWQEGDTVRARAYADSSLAESKRQADAAPDNPELRVLHGLMLAYVRKPAEARAASARAQELAATTLQSSGLKQYVALNAVRIELALNNPTGALDLLEKYRNVPGMLTRKYMELDPTFALIRDNSRFAKVVPE